MLPFLACSAGQTEPAEPDDVGSGAVIGEVILTTRVAPITFEPATASSNSFPSSTRRLFASFQVRSGALPRAFLVTWHRRGDTGPLFSDRMVATGYHWMAAEYEGGARLEPGDYVVRVAADGEVLAEADFAIEGPGAAPGPVPAEVSVEHLRLYRDLDQRGAPVGQPVSVLPASTPRVHAAFRLSDAPAGTSVQVRWRNAGEVVATTELGQVSGSRDLMASLAPGGELTSGLYRAEVVVNGVVLRSRAFTVEGAAARTDLGPRVENLVLTTAVQPRTGRPAAAAVTVVPADVPSLYLSFTFAGMPPDEVVEVRWLRTDAPDPPVATITFQVTGRGSLAASLAPDDPLEPGGYRVEITRRGQLMGSLRFTVDAEDPPETGSIP